MALAENTHIGTCKGKYTNTIYVPDAMFSHLSEETRCSASSVISEMYLFLITFMQYLFMGCLHTGSEGWIVALLKFCLSLFPHFAFCTFSYCSSKNYV